MQSTLEVTDLFRSAFFLCMGGNLEQVRVRNHAERDRRRRIATFLITGCGSEPPGEMVSHLELCTMRISSNHRLEEKIFQTDFDQKNR
jgi:hypothetical protein